eukprot:m.69131 g.69131  ORF g.69131 m.69131 type:complete len:489 (+) comp7534_c0_seq3:34-1500(+)
MAQGRWLAVRSTDMVQAICYERHHFDGEGKSVLVGFHRRIQPDSPKCEYVTQPVSDFLDILGPRSRFIYKDTMSDSGDWQTLNTDENIARKFEFDAYLEYRDAYPDEVTGRIQAEAAGIDCVSEHQPPECWYTWDTDQGISFSQGEQIAARDELERHAGSPPTFTTASGSMRKSSSAFMAEFSRSVRNHLRQASLGDVFGADDGLDWEDDQCGLEDSLAASSLSSLSFGRASHVDETASIRASSPPHVRSKGDDAPTVQTCTPPPSARPSLCSYASPSSPNIDTRFSFASQGSQSRKRSVSPTLLFTRATSLLEPLAESTIKLENLGDGFTSGVNGVKWINHVVEDVIFELGEELPRTLEYTWDYGGATTYATEVSDQEQLLHEVLSAPGYQSLVAPYRSSQPNTPSSTGRGVVLGSVSCEVPWISATELTPSTTGFDDDSPRGTPMSTPTTPVSVTTPMRTRYSSPLVSSSMKRPSGFFSRIFAPKS